MSEYSFMKNKKRHHLKDSIETFLYPFSHQVYAKQGPLSMLPQEHSSLFFSYPAPLGPKDRYLQLPRQCLPHCLQIYYQIGH